MPLFETVYGGKGKLKDGREVAVPPRTVLQRMGPCLPVIISATQEHQDTLVQRGIEVPNPISGTGLIDTGASVTAVDEDVCRKMALTVTSAMQVSHPGGNETRACYAIQIHFPGTPIPPLIAPMAISVNLGGGQPPYILLISRDLLAHLRMVYNGPMGRIELAF